MGPDSEMTGMIGCLYIDGNPFCNISSFEMDVDGSEQYIDECVHKAVVKFRDEITFTCTMRWDSIAYLKVIGLWSWAIDNCPNKRVTYLMEHGKTRRVRYKNFNRAVRIIAKILNDANA